jgi:predicted small secreted protein
MGAMKAAAIVLLVLVVLAGCAPGPNAMKGAGDASGDVAGFLDGLWHGIIMPITFVISLFSDNVNVYDVNNNGGWYNFGYLLGLSGTLGGGSKGATSRRRRG